VIWLWHLMILMMGFQWLMRGWWTWSMPLPAFPSYSLPIQQMAHRVLGVSLAFSLSLSLARYLSSPYFPCLVLLTLPLSRFLFIPTIRTPLLRTVSLVPACLTLNKVESHEKVESRASRGARSGGGAAARPPEENH